MTSDLIDLMYVFIGLPIIFVIGIAVVIISRRKRRSYPACLKCGYDIRGIIGSKPQCPECGDDISKGKHQIPNQLPVFWQYANTIGFCLMLLSGIPLVIALIGFTLTMIR